MGWRRGWSIAAVRLHARHKGVSGEQALSPCFHHIVAGPGKGERDWCRNALLLGTFDTASIYSCPHGILGEPDRNPGFRHVGIRLKFAQLGRCPFQLPHKFRRIRRTWFGLVGRGAISFQQQTLAEAARYGQLTKRVRRQREDAGFVDVVLQERLTAEELFRLGFVMARPAPLIGKLGLICGCAALPPRTGPGKRDCNDWWK
jgi:hypothetical protein